MASDRDNTRRAAAQGQAESPELQSSELQISENVTFEQAIALTQAWLDRVEQTQLSPDQTERAIAQLIATMNGARGFFVAFLTDKRPLDDRSSDAVLRALSQPSAMIASLLVKNLAMSSAMAIAHQRREDEANAQGSERVRSRTLDLIQNLSSPVIQTEIEALKQSLESNEGTYHSFLTRWGYDAEQRQAIDAACDCL
ncbi:MAG: hypothetical protein WBA57_04950 [Elainellaceae cyanobacterium]